MIIIFPSSIIKRSNLFSFQITTAQNGHEIFFKRWKRSSFQKLRVWGLFFFFNIYPNDTLSLKQNMSVRLEAQSLNLTQQCFLSTFHKAVPFFQSSLYNLCHVLTDIGTMKYRLAENIFLSCRCYKSHITVKFKITFPPKFSSLKYFPLLVWCFLFLHSRTH